MHIFQESSMEDRGILHGGSGNFSRKAIYLKLRLSYPQSTACAAEAAKNWKIHEHTNAQVIPRQGYSSGILPDSAGESCAKIDRSYLFT
jgi:hypothetical protein